MHEQSQVYNLCYRARGVCLALRKSSGGKRVGDKPPRCTWGNVPLQVNVLARKRGGQKSVGQAPALHKAMR